MELNNATKIIIPCIKSVILFVILMAIVLIVNANVISFDMLYPEQPTIYLANQKIKSLHDLLTIYLHPQWLHSVVPFFRPSGHFLVYQMLMPLLGWHNTKGLIVINFIFLALTGYCMIAIYRLLFPNNMMGGFVAFGLYLMHPALSLSRFITLHFEFAYTFFLLLGLYFFIFFCKKNSHDAQINSQQSTFNAPYLLAFALFFYAIAVTFKEPAIMLGPVFMSYFLIMLYKKPLTKTFFLTLICKKEVRNIFILFGISTFTLALYLTLPWQTMSHPLRKIIPDYSLGAINELLKAFIGTDKNLFAHGILLAAGIVWRSVIFPPIALFIIQLSVMITIIVTIFICLNTSNEIIFYNSEISAASV